MLIADVSFAELFFGSKQWYIHSKSENNFWSIAPSVVDIYLVMSAITWAQTTVCYLLKIAVKAYYMYMLLPSSEDSIKGMSYICDVCYPVVCQVEVVCPGPYCNLIKVSKQKWCTAALNEMSDRSSVYCKENVKYTWMCYSHWQLCLMLELPQWNPNWWLTCHHLLKLFD